MNDDPLRYLREIISVATGGDAYAMEQVTLVRPTRMTDALNFLRDHGLVAADEVRTDVRRAFNGRPPSYFASTERLVKQFCHDHSVPTPTSRETQSAGMRHVSEVADDLIQELESNKPTDPFQREGLACPQQRSAFYESSAWKRRAAAVRVMDRFTCQRCDESETVLHVHHKMPIQAVFGRTFYKNFETIRLVTYCQSCHEDYHQSTVRTPNGFHPATEESFFEERKQDKKRIEQHDAAQECRWCQRFVWN